MRVPERFVKLVHRVLGFREGALLIRKKGGQVVAVELDGRALAPGEWSSVELFHVEQKGTAVQKVLTGTEPRA